MSHSPKRTQISTDVALRDIVNKKEQMLRFEAGIGLIHAGLTQRKYTVAGAVSGLHRR